MKLKKYKLNINGKEHAVQAMEDMPLLWVIRDLIGLKGTKFGCGKGLCGACTIHLDKEATRSCQMTIGDLENEKITTIEGLSKNTDHPCQLAWEKHQVPQCGYCQPGQLMSAAALLNENKKPSDEDIQDFMSGNICRCGTYQRIKAAIKDAAQAKA